MAPRKNQAPAAPPPPLPTSAAPAPPPLPTAAPVEAAVVPRVQLEGVVYEAHPEGTAQYIAELEAENAQYLAERAEAAGRAVEGFKAVATVAITHAAAMQGYGGPMAGHLPQDLNAIPGIDAINAAGPQ